MGMREGGTDVRLSRLVKLLVTAQPWSPRQRRLTLAVGETHGQAEQVPASRQRRLRSSIADATRELAYPHPVG